MKTIKLNSKSLWAQVYQSWYVCLPSNTCEYRKKSIFLIFVLLFSLPLLIPISIILLFNKEYRYSFVNDNLLKITATFQLAGIFVTFVILSPNKISEMPFSNVMISILLGGIFFTMSIFVLIIWTFGIIEISKYLKNKSMTHNNNPTIKKDKVRKIKKDNLIKIFYKNIKDKVCNKIDWDD